MERYAVVKTIGVPTDAELIDILHKLCLEKIEDYEILGEYHLVNTARNLREKEE